LNGVEIMSDPFTAITAGSTAISGISSLFGAGAAKQGGEDRAAMDNYKAYIAAQNAQIALQNQTRDVAVGDIAGYNNDLRMRQRIGGAEADAGASGFSVGDSASIKAGISSLHDVGRMDTLQIIDNAKYKGYTDLMQSYNYTQEALMDQRAAQNDLAAGDIQATSTLLGGATSIADKWAGYYRKTR
jgi:hypothetical protein